MILAGVVEWSYSHSSLQRLATRIANPGLVKKFVIKWLLDFGAILLLNSPF